MIQVCIFNAHGTYRRRVSGINNLTLRVLKNENVRHGELNIVFINDRRMLAMNGKYLGHWFATDVLSFPIGDSPRDVIGGEVYVNLDQARRQSKEYGVSFNNEIDRLVVHGILHLLGYDDTTTTQRKRMTLRENTYVGLSG